jgi:hypothetical protein
VSGKIASACANTQRSGLERRQTCNQLATANLRQTARDRLIHEKPRLAHRYSGSSGSTPRQLRVDCPGEFAKARFQPTKLTAQVASLDRI